MGVAPRGRGNSKCRVERACGIGGLLLRHHPRRGALHHPAPAGGGAADGRRDCSAHLGAIFHACFSHLSTTTVYADAGHPTPPQGLRRLRDALARASARIKATHLGNEPLLDATGCGVVALFSCSQSYYMFLAPPSERIRLPEARAPLSCWH